MRNANEMLISSKQSHQNPTNGIKWAEATAYKANTIVISDSDSRQEYYEVTRRLSGALDAAKKAINNWEHQSSWLAQQLKVMHINAYYGEGVGVDGAGEKDGIKRDTCFLQKAGEKIVSGTPLNCSAQPREHRIVVRYIKSWASTSSARPGTIVSMGHRLSSLVVTRRETRPADSWLPTTGVNGRRI